MSRAAGTAAVAFVALLAACAPSSHPVANVSSSPSASTTAAGSKPMGVCDASHRCLALVTLRGSDNLIVRDITDLDHPATVANLAPRSAGGDYGQGTMHFVNANELAFLLNSQIVTAPLAGSPTTVLQGVAGAADNYAWSPDGMTVVYTTGDNQKIDVHLLRAGTDRVVGSTPGLGVGGCEVVSSCTVPNWLDVRLAFSRDGRSFSYVAQGFGASFFRVWSADGTLLMSTDGRATTMSAWSGQTLYYRDAGGVKAWIAGVGKEFLPGVTWIRPSASPAGGAIVYTVRDAGGWGHIYAVDTTTGKARELKAQRSEAVFLTSRYIWYRGERACVEADQCGPNPPFHPSNGKTYIYDLQAGVEYESIITNVYDVWPHAA